MENENKHASIEEMLDAIDKFKNGDENAFEGMTIVLDGDISEEKNKTISTEPVRE